MKKYFRNLVFSLFVSAELCAAVLGFVHLQNRKAEVILLGIVFVVAENILLTLGLNAKNYDFRKKLATAAAVPLFCCVVLCSLYGLKQAGKTDDLDAGNESIYGGRKVMFLVPHGDDEILLAGGMPESFVKYGSEVYIVYATNGDYEGVSTERLKESLKVCRSLGIDKEHTVFLGYGDDWNDTAHIYNKPEDDVCESHAGSKKTYGLKTKKAFSDGALYTLANYEKDIKNLLLEIRPDAVFCTDYDEHCDHRCLSLLLDRAVGEILKGNDSYRPRVYKGFAYSCSLFAGSSFAGKNIASTKNPYEKDIMEENNTYHWEERIRFPVAAASLSYRPWYCGMYKTMSLYGSQDWILESAENFIKGDRVFWQRDTDSPTYKAVFTATSGDASVLNDFLLYDSSDVNDYDNPPTDGTGVWIPLASDETKSVTCDFGTARKIDRIVIYDNPSVYDNVTGVIVSFPGIPDGDIYCDEINPCGRTELYFNPVETASFTVTVVSSEGAEAGFSEIEAYYGENGEDGIRTAKLVSCDDDFVYDYYFTSSDSEEFNIYSRGLGDYADEKFTVSVSNRNCGCTLRDGIVTVFCPANEKTYLEISSDGTLYDRCMIYGRKSGKIHRLSLYLEGEMDSFSELDYVKSLIS